MRLLQTGNCLTENEIEKIKALSRAIEERVAIAKAEKEAVKDERSRIAAEALDYSSGFTKRRTNP
jgi:hypothetical protein